MLKWKKDRIIENRTFSSKKSPYDIFEKKVVDACYFERILFMKKFNKFELYLARSQYIVFLVSCLEYFFQELFKKSMDEGLVDLEKLKKIKEIKPTTFSVDDLDWINKNKIRLSEIVSLEINFQEIKNIVPFCDALNIVKHFKKIVGKKEKASPKFPEFLKVNPSKVKKTFDKKFTKFILKEFGTAYLPKTEKDLIRAINTVGKMISLRHKIIHKAHLVKIKNWESLAYTMATMQLAFFAYNSYLLEKREQSLKTTKRLTRAEG